MADKNLSWKAWVLLQYPKSKATEWAEGWVIHYTGNPMTHRLSDFPESLFYSTAKKAWEGAAKELLEEQQGRHNEQL